MRIRLQEEDLDRVGIPGSPVKSPLAIAYRREKNYSVEAPVVVDMAEYLLYDYLLRVKYKISLEGMSMLRQFDAGNWVDSGEIVLEEIV